MQEMDARAVGSWQTDVDALMISLGGGVCRFSNGWAAGRAADMVWATG